MSWATLAIVAAALGGMATVTNKYVFVRVTHEPVIQAIFGGIVGVIIASALPLVHGNGHISSFHALLAISAGLSFGLSLFIWLHAIRIGHVSRVGPLRLLSPLFVAILAAIFLGEVFSLRTYTGVFLIIAGAAALSGRKINTIKADKVLWLAMLAAVFLAVMQVTTKYLLRFADPYTIFFYIRLGLLLFTLPLLAMHIRKIKIILRVSPVRKLLQLSLGGMFGTAGMLLTTYAASKGPVVLVSAVSSTTPFFILLYAIGLSRLLPDVYQEETTIRKTLFRVVVVVVMFVGVVLTL